MPNISEHPQITFFPQRRQIRPITLARAQQLEVIKRRRALTKEINKLEAIIRKKTQEQAVLTQTVELANNHRFDDSQRRTELTRLIRDTVERSIADQERQTELGHHSVELRRLYDEYLDNRPYDTQGIEALYNEHLPLRRTVISNARAIVVPLEEERELARINYEQGYETYSRLAQKLLNLSTRIRNLTQLRDNLIKQKDDLNTAQGKNRQRRYTHKNGKKKTY